jgi:hypothetical protein
MLCTQLATDYDAAQVELDDTMASAASAGVQTLPFPSDSEAYFVGDTGHASVGGGMISFTRTLANRPQTITRPSGSEFYTFPGISAISPPIVYTPIDITSMTVPAQGKGVIITTDTDHGLAVADNVTIRMDYTTGTETFINQVCANVRVLALAGTRSIRVDIGRYFPSGTIIAVGSGELKKQRISRLLRPLSYNVATSIRYDYILPGVTNLIDDASDINVPATFQIIGYDSGKILDGVADSTIINGTVTLVEKSIPSATEYIDMINNEHNIVIESSLSEWAGNILVMKTKTCKAQ